jgi:hypothetical protein
MFRQVEYASYVNADANVTRWRFPALYYSFTRTFAAAASGDGCDDGGSSGGDGSSGGGGSGGCGMADASAPIRLQTIVLDTNVINDPRDAAEAATAAAQFVWLRATLQQSNADFIVVAGHHPMYSVGRHGPTASLLKAQVRSATALVTFIRVLLSHLFAYSCVLLIR